MALSQETSTPFVSVVIPMRNEAEHIGRCLESLRKQEYRFDRFEVLVVDGRSDDGSAATVRRFCDDEPAVRLLDNPARITPVALNIGVRASRGEVIIILGSHSFVEPDFIRRNVEVLSESGADCVGGRIETISDNSIGRVISLAMSSPFGVGNAHFRTSDKPGFVDTVAFGAYRREVFDRIGLFDEELAKNQDDEFNFRLTRSGGRIYLDPGIKSSYWSRPTLGKLWNQYYQYGRWKVRILRKHGRLPSWRHLAPAAALTLFLATMAMAAVKTSLLWLPLSMFLLYLLISVLYTIRLMRENGPQCLLLPIAFVTLHLSYAMGFISGLPQLTAGRD